MNVSESDRLSISAQTRLNHRLPVSDDGKTQHCLYCQSAESEEILDLGSQPLANSLLLNRDQPELHYPLRLHQCKGCGLIQRNTIPQLDTWDFFNDVYPYRTSINQGYVKQTLEFLKTLDLKGKRVLEIGCNDAPLMQAILDMGAMSYQGLDPAFGTEAFSSSWANDKGFPGYKHFDLVIANNVMAHVPDLYDFIEGLTEVCPDGEIYVEVPSFEMLIREQEIDTIYHEHFSYFTRWQLPFLMEKHGFKTFSIEDIPSHGGSFRYGFSKVKGEKSMSPFTFEFPANFQDKLMCFKAYAQGVLRGAYSQGPIMAFGAAAKGATLLNFLGVKRGEIAFCIDDTPEKQGKYMPGSRIPIVSHKILEAVTPHLILILAWNHEKEIKARLSKLTSARLATLWEI